MIGAVLAAAVVLVQAASGAASGAAAPSAPDAPPSAHGVSGVTVTAPPKHPALDPNELICHREPVLGTLFPKEVCATRQEIADRRRVDQGETRNAHNHAALEVLNPADKR